MILKTNLLRQMCFKTNFSRQMFFQCFENESLYSYPNPDPGLLFIIGHDVCDHLKVGQSLALKNFSQNQFGLNRFVFKNICLKKFVLKNFVLKKFVLKYLS